MPVVSRLAARLHTVESFRSAARERYRDGVQLADAGRRLGAIYLLGYSVEMLLKAAYFRLRGWGDTPITVADMNQARNRAINVLHLTWNDRLHDLVGWVTLLINERVTLQQPLAWRFRRTLNARVGIVYRNWREHLRYHDSIPYATELNSVRATATWLLAQYPQL